MHQYVLTQIPLQSERLATMITLMRLLPSVDKHVLRENTTQREFLTADFARVRLLACVEQLVPVPS